MIDISINSVIGDLADKLKSVDTDTMLKEIAVNVLPEIRERVHVRGEASDESQIGTYSDGYMRVRTGNYPETVITRGKNKGQFREKKEKEGQAGYFTKGRSMGKARSRYNWPNDSKVILALTGKMQGQMIEIKTDNGWGIGYTNESDYNKAIWNELRYKKDIWSLSIEELNIMESTAERYIEKLND